MAGILPSMAQGLIDPLKESKDTMIIKVGPEPGKSIMAPGLLMTDFVNSPLETELHIPDFKTFFESRWISRYSFFPAPGNFNSVTMFEGPSGFTAPFLNSGVIFNQAAYRISDRVIIGGAGFGGRSIFSAPLPGNLTNSFDTRGASMFFQYKVSPKFKIETRISVTQGPGF